MTLEEAEWRERLARKAAAVEAARVSLLERVRELVNDYSTARSEQISPVYIAGPAFVNIEAVQIALAEYDRVRAMSATEAADAH